MYQETVCFICILSGFLFGLAFMVLWIDSVTLLTSHSVAFEFTWLKRYNLQPGLMFKRSLS